MNKARLIAFCVVSITVLFSHNSGFTQSNSPPTITADFETIIIKEDITTLDSTWSAPVVTGVPELGLVFATDADGDSLTWSGRSEHLTFLFQDSALYAVPPTEMALPDTTRQRFSLKTARAASTPWLSMW